MKTPQTKSAMEVDDCGIVDRRRVACMGARIG